MLHICRWLSKSGNWSLTFMLKKCPRECGIFPMKPFLCYMIYVLLKICSGLKKKISFKDLILGSLTNVKVYIYSVLISNLICKMLWMTLLVCIKILLNRSSKQKSHDIVIRHWIFINIPNTRCLDMKTFAKAFPYCIT